MTERQITGKQVFFVVASAFSIIIGVNLTLAFKAVSTFPGLEVKNSYVASQSFEERRDAQDALGWDVAVTYDANALLVTFTDADGREVKAQDVALLIGRKTNSTDDQTPDLSFQNGVFRAPLDLAPGYWTIRLTAAAEDGTPFQKRLSLRVRG